jgi:hypothetical protein
VSDGLHSFVVLHWVRDLHLNSAQESSPGPFVGEAKESALFYGNRVIKDFKDSEFVALRLLKS